MQQKEANNSLTPEDAGIKTKETNKKAFNFSSPLRMTRKSKAALAVEEPGI